MDCNYVPRATGRHGGLSKSKCADAGRRHDLDGQAGRKGWVIAYLAGDELDGEIH